MSKFRSFVPPPKDPLPVTPEYIGQVAGWLEEKPRVFMPPATDRAAWNSVPLDKYAVTRQAEENLKQKIPKLTEELYLDFMESGKREPFTVPYNEWIDRASLLALAESLEFKGRFIPALRETLLEIYSERSWVYPMHDGPLGWPAFKEGKTYIDLGAAMRAAELAAIDGWLGGQLGSDLQARLRAEIMRRIVEPYFGYVFGNDRARGWWWVVSHTNWNSVCHAGVTYAVLSLIDDLEIRAKVAASAARHTDIYFTGFTPDGYISEGLGYWNYGYGNFVVLAETLARATGGKIDLYRAHAEKVGAVSSYPVRVEIAPGIYPAFSDCPFDATPAPWIFSLLARRVELPASVVSTKLDWSMKGAITTGFIKDLSLAPPAVTGPRIPIPGYNPLRGFFEEAGVLVSRSAVPGRGIAAAYKGGHNDEMHNHNDVGSFTLTCDGKAVIADVGGEIYHLRTFSDQRYESRILSSHGHPVPIIDGQLQAVGRAADAKVLEAVLTEASDKLVIDMTAAYPVKGLEMARRTFELKRGEASSFTVTDDIALLRPVTIDSGLSTLGSFERVGENQLRVFWKDGAVRVEIDTEGEPYTIRDEVLTEKLSVPDSARRIGIVLDRPVQRARIRFRITPA
jgi:hypothetical protein